MSCASVKSDMIDQFLNEFWTSTIPESADGSDGADVKMTYLR
jgi:hypothetical protein